MNDGNFVESNNVNINNEVQFIAFFFDSSKISDSFYGNVIFKNFIEGMEISTNSRKIVFSIGDILNNSIYDDITPFTVRDSMCTIKRSGIHCMGNLFVFLLEDIETQIAIAIDKRLKSNFSAYLGMTSVDINSTDTRKQFWKSLIRYFSIEGETITYFGSGEEDFFGYSKTAKDKGFRINYDGFSDDFAYNSDGELYSTRQSSFIYSTKQLKILEGHNDSDRGILEMNFSLGKEVEIAGVQIWKAIEDINLAYIPKDKKNSVTTDYIFTSLYQASQGVEKLSKVILELIMYSNEDNGKKQKINDLLFSHNHTAMYDFFSKIKNIELKSNSKRLLNILSNFYSNVRYHRFRYNNNDVLELKLMQDFGHEIKENLFDEQIKHLYGKALGQIARAFYKLIENLSHELNIFTYELNSQSVANFAFISYYDEDLYEVLKKIEQSKKELIWYLMNKEWKLPDELLPLPFEEEANDIVDYIKKLVMNDSEYSMLYDFVSQSYDELVKQDKENWKKRIEIIDALIGNSNVF